MAMTVKNTQIYAKVQETTKTKLEKIANDKGISLSNVVRRAIFSYYKFEE